MTSTNEDLALRIERLERNVRRLVSAAADERREDPVNRLSFLAWLKLSGPTFAVMVFGFGLLWQAQQVNTSQLVERSRTVGQLEGAITGLQAQITRLSEAIDELSEHVDAR